MKAAVEFLAVGRFFSPVYQSRRTCSKRFELGALVVFSSFFHGCVNRPVPKEFQEEVQGSNSGESVAEPKPPDAELPQSSPQAAKSPVGLPDKPTSDCLPVSGISGDLPYYLPNQNIVITRFVSPCLPSKGGIGLSPKTQWLAMGFPCTGGGGRIDIKGKYHNPNAVSFVIGTECTMNPSSKEQVQNLAVDKVGMPKDTTLAAFLPFVVQFWEVAGLEDADTGFTIDLRSPPALEGVWKRFRENHGFSVRLYGRENSWVPGGHFYQVDASLHQDGRTTFKLQVQSAKKLSDEDALKVRRRCELLRPARNCGAVF
jgi:hypothetical protein